jgi:outer membrane protein
MKRFLIKWIPALLLFAMMQGVASAQMRIATVDLSRVFTNYWKFKQADTALQDMRSEMSKSYDELKKTGEKANETYNGLLAEANNQVLSSEERDKKKKAAEEKLREMGEIRRTMEQFEKQAFTRLQEQRSRMRENLLTEINAVVKSRGKAGNYTLVFDSAGKTADQTPIILYTTAEDITDSILAQLNAGAPVDLDDRRTPARPADRK